MALVPHTITALERDTASAQSSGKQVVTGAVCSMYHRESGAVAIMYDDEFYTNGATSKTTNSNGQVTVYVEPGEYRLSVNSIDSYISITEKFKYVDTREPQGDMLSGVKSTITDKWSGRSVSILGDSISWGSNCPDVYSDSYAAVLRKLLLLENGSESIGFISSRGVATNAEGTYNDYHTVTTSGSWSFKNLGDATTIINGFSRYSSTPGDYLDFNVPFETTQFRVFYRAFSGGGTFTISNNGGGTVQQTVDSNATEDGSAISPLVAMVDSGDGTSDIRIEVVSGTVEITGIQYLNAFDDFVVNNFSDPGRKILHTDNSVFDDACTSETLIFALGYNDRDSSAGEKVTVASKLDYLVTQVKANKTKLYVIDTNWGYDSSTWIRQELRQMASEVAGAVYIPLPDLLSSDGSLLSISELRDTYGFLSDGAHPTPAGHKNMAQTIAKNMGLSVSSKGVEQTIRAGNFTPTSGTFTPTVTFATAGDFSPTYLIQEGAYRKIGDMVYFAMTVRFDTNAFTTASGNFRITSLPFTSKTAGAAGISFYDFACSIGVVQNVTFDDTMFLSASVIPGSSYIEFRQNDPSTNGLEVGTSNIPASTSNIRIALSGWYFSQS